MASNTKNLNREGLGDLPNIDASLIHPIDIEALIVPNDPRHPHQKYWCYTALCVSARFLD